MESSHAERLRRELRVIIGLTDDPEAVAVVQGLAEEFQQMIAERVRVLTTEGTPRSYSWADIAQPLGITRQAAWKRYAARKE